MGDRKIGRPAREQTREEGREDRSSRSPSRRRKPVEKGEKPAAPAEPKPDGEKAEESPDPVPGAFLRASVYDDHFVTFGSPAEVFPLVNTDLILSPLKPTDGRNLVNFAPRDLLVSGFCWPQTLELMAGKPLVVVPEPGQRTRCRFCGRPQLSRDDAGVRSGSS